MTDVFVSYKAEDRRRVQPLVLALQADGYRVWWDEHIGTGDEWRQTIERELDNASCVIVVWSKRSVGPDGHFVRDEASRAQRKHVYVPVLIDAVDPPLGFGERQATSIRGWKGDRTDARYESVLASVRHLAGAPTGVHSPKPGRDLSVSRRTAMAGGVIAVGGVAALGGWALMKPGTASAADSIAVLPFANLSGDPGQSYFSDGIAEELRSALARLGGLRVVGRTSSEAVRDDDAETAAEKLRVGNILTGSVRQTSSTIRVAAQLVDGRDGVEKWSNSYDRPPGDAIKIQTDIAENVARALSAALGGAARAAIALGGTSDPTAHQLLLRAQQAARLPRATGVPQAIALAQSAIELDRNFADAYAVKAGLETVYANNLVQSVGELEAYRENALRDVSTALKLAPDLPAAHRVLGFIYQFDFRIAEALRQYQRALQLAPSDGVALLSYSFLLSRLGNRVESLRLSDKAIAVDPLNPAAYRSRFTSHTAARDYAEAVQYAQELERSNPELMDWPEALGLALVFLARFEEGQKYFDRAPADNYTRLVGEALLLSRTGKGAKIEEKVEALRRAYGDAASYQMAEVYAIMTDRDRAFAALARGIAIRDAGLLGVKTDALLDPLRNDPRFITVLRKVNFPA